MDGYNSIVFHETLLITRHFSITRDTTSRITKKRHCFSYFYFYFLNKVPQYLDMRNREFCTSNRSANAIYTFSHAGSLQIGSLNCNKILNSAFLYKTISVECSECNNV